MGIQINGNNDTISALDGSWTAQGATTFTGAADFNGKVSVGGTLTYEDVTNIDSVGIVTARTGIHIDDSITHIGDTNTKIRFPAIDTITAETGGSERVRIDSSGRVLINTSTAGEATSDSLTIQTRSNHAGVTIRSSTSGSGCVYFADGTSGNAQYRGFVEYVHSSDYLKFGTTGTERLRIDSSGNVLVGTTDATVYNNSGSGNDGIVLRGGNVIDIARSNDLQLTLNRLASDGAMVAFYRDATHKATINITSSALTIGMPTAEALRIDSSGCVRVGNTHTQTTSGNTKRIALGGKGSIQGWVSGQLNGLIQLVDNYYWDGANNKAIEADHCAYLSLRSGTLRFGATNSSQTAGQNVSGGITERFRITQNGRVNIGTGELDQTDRMLNVYGGRMRISGIPANNNSFEVYANSTTGQSHGILIDAGTNGSDICAHFRQKGGSNLFQIRGDGNIRIGAGSLALPKATQGGVDIDSGAYTACIGGNVNSSGRTNSTDKINRITSPHYTNAEEPVALVSSYNQSGNNFISYGGGSSITNAATQHIFYTAANTTTTAGTERLRITSDGYVRIGGNEGNYPLVVIDESNRTTTADTQLHLYAKHDGSGTTGVGFGGGIRFWGDRASGNVEQNMGRIMCIADVNSGTTLSSAFTFETGVAGVLGEKVRITSEGKLYLGSGINSNANGYKMSIKETSAENAMIIFLDTDNMRGGFCGIVKGANQVYTGTTNVDFLVGSTYANTTIITGDGSSSTGVRRVTVQKTGEVQSAAGGFVSYIKSDINVSHDTHTWTSNQWNTVINSNAFGNSASTYLVNFHWSHEGFGVPWIVRGNFLWTPTGANHNGAVGASFVPVQCGHSFYGPSRTFQFQGVAAGNVRAGVQARALNWDPSNSSSQGILYVRATRVADDWV